MKVASKERINSEDGCYPAPDALASAIGGKVAPSVKKAKKVGVVYVVTAGSSCSRVIMAYRSKGAVSVLDTNTGNVVTKELSSPLSAGAGAHASRSGGGLPRVTKTYRVSPGDSPRLEVICPKGKYPLGGGMTSSPGISADGSGIYPHSYERLGEQHGWHITPILFQSETSSDESLGTPPRTVQVQAVCGPEALTPDTTVRRVLFLKEGDPLDDGPTPPGTPQTASVTCPKGQYLLSGGFQRTSFNYKGGSYVSESRAVGSKSWRVSGRAFGSLPGELVALAYCMRSDGPLLSSVSGKANVGQNSVGTARTRGCPGGRVLTAGGFSSGGSHNLLIGDGSLNANGTWSQSAYGFFGSASVTAYGYCMRKKLP